MASAALPSARSSTGLLRWQGLVAAGVFATTLSSPTVIDLPIRTLLRRDLALNETEMAGFFFLVNFAWYVKPLLGIGSDHFPLFGTRRRSYLIMAAAMAALFWSSAGMMPLTFRALLITLVGASTMIAIGSTVMGGVLVDAGQHYKAVGRLVAVRAATESACNMVGGPLGAALAKASFGTAGIAISLIAFALAPAAFVLARDHEIPDWRPRTREPLRSVLASALRSRPLWAVAGSLFFFYACPGFTSTPLYFHQTATLQFSTELVGTLKLVTGLGGLAAAAIYGFVWRRVSLRYVLVGGIVTNAACTLSFLWYRSPHVALFIHAAAGFATSVVGLSFMDMAIKAAPRETEATTFAVLMSIWNIADACSDFAGAALMNAGGVSFRQLVAINALIPLLVLVAVPFAPATLLNRSDARRPRPLRS